jgi:hypothetical protein
MKGRYLHRPFYSSFPTMLWDMAVIQIKCGNSWVKINHKIYQTAARLGVVPSTVTGRDIADFLCRKNKPEGVVSLAQEGRR